MLNKMKYCVIIGLLYLLAFLISIFDVKIGFIYYLPLISWTMIAEGLVFKAYEKRIEDSKFIGNSIFVHVVVNILILSLHWYIYKF